MTIAYEIQRLIDAKAAIKAAIERKGVEVGDGPLLSYYPNYIDKIAVGDGEFYRTITNNGTDYSYLFYMIIEPSRIPDVSTWDVSNAQYMDSMFYACANTTSLDLSNWYAPNLSNASHMFDSCQQLQYLDLSNFYTSSITDMSYMFYSCQSLYELNLSNWYTGNVTNMNGMFTYCYSLQSIYGELDLSNLSDGFYPNYDKAPFRGCSSLYWLELKYIYSNCSMDNDSKWTIDLGDTMVCDDCLRNIINELPDLYNDKGLSETDQIILVLPTSNGLYDGDVQPAIDKGWTVTNTNF